MRSIIVAYAKQKDGERIRTMLLHHGIETAEVCTAGAQVLMAVSEFGDCVVIMGYRLRDMAFGQLAEELPPGCDILLVTSPANVMDEELPENTVFLPTPLATRDLIQSLQLMLGTTRSEKRHKKPERSEDEKKTIELAKTVLMNRHHMTEPEAHRYLQKCAMDTGTKLLEMAEMVLLMENSDE